MKIILGCRLLLFFCLIAIGSGCNSASNQDLTQFKTQTMATQLSVDVRIFHAISTGDTNTACKLLAARIDFDIIELYQANKAFPLDQSSSSLYRSALNYRKTSDKLAKYAPTNAVNGVSVSSIIQEFK